MKLQKLQKSQNFQELSRKTFKLQFEPDKNYWSEYEMLLNGLFGLQFTLEKGNNPYFTFGVISKGDKTDFYINLPDEFIDIFKKKYAAINSYIQFEEINDPLSSFSSTLEKGSVYHVEGYNMRLLENDKEKKLKTSEAQKRFMVNLLNSMNNTGTNNQSVMEVTIQATTCSQSNDFSNKIVKGLFTTTDVAMKGLGFLLNTTVMNGKLSSGQQKSKKSTKSEENNEGDIETYSFSPQFLTSIKVMSKSQNKKQVTDNIKGMAAVFSDLTDKNSLVPIKNRYDELIKRNVKQGDILTAQEIVQFLHLPDKTVSSENIKTSNCRKIFDRNIPEKGLVFGISNNKPVAFPMVPLSVETYKKLYEGLQKIVDNIVKPRLVLGQQGTGKSEWVINYTLLMARLGIGVIIVDPKNDTQQRLIESLDDSLMSKLDYINFGDTDYPPSMNIFRKRQDDDPTENSLIVTSFISLMKKEFGRNWGFKIQRTLQMTSEVILLNETSTLNEFEMMLTERVFREFMIEKMEAMLNDSNKKGKAHIKKLLKYWVEFNKRTDEFIAKDVEPVMNQIGVFLSNRVIKAIVSQKESYDFRKAADEGRIVVVNIPEGVLGDNTKLLASMINKAIWLDIQSRADVDISDRYPVAWIIDEAHEIVDDEFVGVLTKARAYRLGLTLVTQGLSNFKMRGMEDIRELILTNCKNKVAFRIGPFDARDLAEEFEPLSGNDLANCPDYHFYAKILLENGNVSDPFFASAPPVAKKIRNYDSYLKKHQSGKFTVDEIEDELENRLDYIHVLNKLSLK